MTAEKISTYTYDDIATLAEMRYLDELIRVESADLDVALDVLRSRNQLRRVLTAMALVWIKGQAEGTADSVHAEFDKMAWSEDLGAPMAPSPLLKWATDKVGHPLAGSVLAAGRELLEAAGDLGSVEHERHETARKTGKPYGTGSGEARWSH